MSVSQRRFSRNTSWIVTGGAVFAASLAAPLQATERTEPGSRRIEVTREPDETRIRQTVLSLIDKANAALKRNDFDVALTLSDNAVAAAPASETRLRLLAASLKVAALSGLEEYAEAMHVVDQYAATPVTTSTRSVLAMLLDYGAGACDDWARVVAEEEFRRELQNRAVDLQLRILKLYPHDIRQRVYCCQRLNELSRHAESLRLTQSLKPGEAQKLNALRQEAEAGLR